MCVGVLKKSVGVWPLEGRCVIKWQYAAEVSDREWSVCMSTCVAVYSRMGGLDVCVCEAGKGRYVRE